MANNQNISIRLAVLDANGVRREFTLTGETARRAMEQIEESTQEASRSLEALNAVSENARGYLEGLADSGGGLVSSLARLGPTGLVAAAGIGLLTTATVAGVEKAREMEQIQLKLAAVIKATDYSAGQTSKGLMDFAKGMEATTLRTKGEILQGATILQTFQSISGDIFQETLKAAASIQTVMGEDFTGAVERLASALEDPIAAIEELKEVGLFLTPVQQDILKNFMDISDQAGAQRFLIEELQKKYGGAAEAERTGLTGALHGVNSAWNTLLSNWGETITKAPLLKEALGMTEWALKGINSALYPSLVEERNQITKEIETAKKIAMIEKTLNAPKLFDKASGSMEPSVLREKEKRLKEIDDKIESYKQEEVRAAYGAAAANVNRVANNITAKTKTLRDNTEDLTLTPRQKINKKADEEKEKLNAQQERYPYLKKEIDEAQRAVEENRKAQLAQLNDKAAQKTVKANKEIATSNKTRSDSDQRVIENLQKRLTLEEEQDPRKRFVMAELDKLSATASEALRQKVKALSEAYYDRQQAEKQSKQAAEDHKKALQDLNKEFSDLDVSYEKSRQEIEAWKSETIQALGGVASINEETIQKIEAVFQNRMAKAYESALQSSDKWYDGATRALKQYAEEATNAAKNAEMVFGNAATNIEDFLVDMASSGEFSMKSFKNLLSSIQKDLTRSFIRENITGPLAAQGSSFFKQFEGSESPSDMGSMLGSFFHTGGVVGYTPAPQRSFPSSVFLNAPRFHNGLMPDEIPAILQRGETVLPKGTSLGGHNITFNISTPNAQSFLESQGQIMNRLGAQLSKYRQRNG